MSNFHFWIMVCAALIGGYFGSLLFNSYPFKISRRKSELPTPDILKSSKELELTLEAEKAIRGYMLKLIAVPTLILSISTFLLGFFLRETASVKAYQEAYNSAYNSASIEAIKAAQLIGEAKTRSEQALLIATTAVEVIQKSQKETEETLKTTKANVAQVEGILKRENENIQGFVEAILKDKDLKAKVIENLNQPDLFKPLLKSYLTREIADKTYLRLDSLKLHAPSKTGYFPLITPSPEWVPIDIWTQGVPAKGY